MDKRFENFTITVLKMSKLVQKIKMLEVEDYQLKAVHVMCVYYLCENPSGLTASELSRYTLEDKAAISRALTHLKEEGYVQYDAKKYNAVVKLTKKGEELAAVLLCKATKAVDFVGGSFTDDERGKFYETIATISENLNTYYEQLKNRHSAAHNTSSDN